MVFSCLSCLWPNRSGTGSQIGSDSQASRRANTVEVASNVQSVFQSSQPRLPSAENIHPLASSRIISPLPSTESDEMDTSVSFRTMQSDEMEMSQTPPNPPSLPVMLKSPNSMDDREDSGSLKEELEEPSPPRKKESFSTPMPFSPRMRPSNNDTMTSFPTLNDQPASFLSLPRSTVWQIRPKSGAMLHRPYETSFKPYYSSEEEG